MAEKYCIEYSGNGEKLLTNLFEKYVECFKKAKRDMEGTSAEAKEHFQKMLLYRKFKSRIDNFLKKYPRHR